MGRPRKKNHLLPPYVYTAGRIYYYCKDGEYFNLGACLKEALILYSSRYQENKKIGTIDDLIDDLLLEFERGDHPDYSHHSAVTIKDYKKHFERFRPVFGHMKPSSLRKSHVYEYRDHRRGAPVQANREISSLKKLMEHAILKGVSELNPANGVRKYPERARERLPSKEDIQAVSQAGDEKIAAYLALKDLLGLRQGDMLSLRWDWMLEAGLKVWISKVRKEVIFAWNDELRAVLERLERVQKAEKVKSDYVICNRYGERYTAGGFRTRWRKARLKALASGALLESYTEHDVRAKVATDLARLYGKEQASKVLIHASVKTTDRYIREVPVVEITGSLRNQKN